MLTLHSVLKSGAQYADWDAFPPQVFSERLARVRAAVAASGDDAWLVYGDAQHDGDLAFLTHFPTRQRGSLLLLRPSGEPVLLAAVGSRDIPASKLLTFVSDMRPYSRLVDALPKLLAAEGLDAARIGLVAVRDALAIAEWDALRHALPNVTWAFRDDAFAPLRRIADPVLAAGVARAAAVAEAGLHRAAEVIVPGAVLRAAAAEIERTLRRAAAEDVRILVGSARGGGVLHPPDDRRLANDDGVLVFVAVVVQRCWAEAGRTLLLGSPPEPVRALERRADAAVDAMAAALGPGETAGALWDAAARVLDAAQLRSAGAYGLGHGIGLDADEAPAILPGSTETFGGCAGIALHAVVRNDDGGALAARTLAGPRA
jgi:Xaa-Pro aminopeptidase